MTQTLAQAIAKLESEYEDMTAYERGMLRIIRRQQRMLVRAGATLKGLSYADNMVIYTCGESSPPEVQEIMQEFQKAERDLLPTIAYLDVNQPLEPEHV